VQFHQLSNFFPEFTANISYNKRRIPMTVGSKSTNIARGTRCPDPVSLKNVEQESLDVAPVAVWTSLGTRPSGWIPCSRQYSSQQELPIWTPAWPRWILMHSRCKHDNTSNSNTQTDQVLSVRFEQFYNDIAKPYVKSTFSSWKWISLSFRLTALRCTSLITRIAFLRTFYGVQPSRVHSGYEFAELFA
jgi:hypothetical protein